MKQLYILAKEWAGVTKFQFNIKAMILNTSLKIRINKRKTPHHGFFGQLG